MQQSERAATFSTIAVAPSGPYAGASRSRHTGTGLIDRLGATAHSLLRNQ